MAKQPKSTSAIVDSLGDGLHAKNESEICIRFERSQTDADLRYVL